MVDFTFFPSRRPHLANHTLPPVHIFALLLDPPPPTNVRTSFMDSPISSGVLLQRHKELKRLCR